MKIIITFLLLVSCISCHNLTAQGELLDQTHAPLYNNNFVFFYTRDAEGVTHMLGQEFTPTLSSLDFVDLYVQVAVISTMSPFALRVEVRDDTINGPLLGTSFLSFSRTNFTGEVRLRFSDSVSLVPGQRYVLRPDVSGKADFIQFGVPRAEAGPPYDGGRFLRDGIASPDLDLWFREGVVVPEPGVQLRTEV